MILFPNVPHADYLKDHVETGVLRAAANTLTGRYAGLAFATAPTVSELVTTRDVVCPGDPGCIQTLIYEVHKVQSGAEPGDVNAFATVRLRPGTIRAYIAGVRDLPDPPETVRQAVTLAVGAPDFHVVVEVVGDSLGEVSERLLELVDVDAVVDFETFLVHRDHAFGWGRVEAELD
jgi:hypothetical protein